MHSFQQQRENLKRPNMFLAEEERALRRILKTKYDKEYPDSMDLFRLQEKFYGLAENGIEAAIDSFKNDPEAVRKYLYGVLDWNQEKIDAFETKHAAKTAKKFIDELIVATFEALYNRYLSPYEITQEPGTTRSKNHLQQKMAQYWWGGSHQILFCKTSDGLLWHLPSEHLLKAIEEKKSVTLKKWPLVQANGKKRKKEKDLKSPPLSKETDIIILPEPKRRKITPPQEKSPALPELPLEIQLRIIMFSSKPSPGVRKLIWNIVKPNTEITVFSIELARPKLVWGWYAAVLNLEPPEELAALWDYHVVQREDPNAFVRKWYPVFLRAYDMREVRQAYNVEALDKRWDVEKVMDSTTLHFIITHLRGGTIGGGSVDHVGAMDFQKVEQDITSAMEILRINNGSPTEDIRSLFRKTMNQTMMEYNAAADRWLAGAARTRMRVFLSTLEISSWKAIRVIREIPETQPLSGKDYAALVWLNNVLMNLARGFSLRKAAKVGMREPASLVRSFWDNFQRKLFFATHRGATEDAYSKTYNKQRYQDRLLLNKWIKASGIRSLMNVEQGYTEFLLKLIEREEEEEEMSSSSKTTTVEITPLPHFWN